MQKQDWKDEDIQKLFKEYRANEDSEYKSKFDELSQILWNICASPIERKLLIEFLKHLHRMFYQFEIVLPDRQAIRIAEKRGLRIRCKSYPDIELFITPQREMSINIGYEEAEEWRPDFVFTLYRLGGIQEKKLDFGQIDHINKIYVNYPEHIDHKDLWEVTTYGAEGRQQNIELSLRSDYIVYRGEFINPPDRVASVSFASDRIAHVVIECDGHDSHERNKLDIRRDRRRDRILQSIGFTVLRYTGSEINDSHSTKSMIDEMYTTLGTIASRLSSIGPIAR